MSTKNEKIRSALKRCGDETIESAIAYHINRDAEQLVVVVKGVIRRFADSKYATVAIDETMSLSENLGYGKMTTMEAIMLLEKVFEIKTTNTKRVGSHKEFQ